MVIHPKSEGKLAPNWLDLPREVTLSILQKLDAVLILESVQWVCTQWEGICKEPSLWTNIIFTYVNINPRLDLESLFMEAVDRRFGGFINLQLLECDCDEFLKFVTKRCTNIRRLRLVGGFVSDERLCEAAEMLPLLEDLDFSCCDMVTSKSLKKLGECCPQLKSLKIIRFFKGMYLMDNVDSEAMAIAENMVELRHLQLVENRLTNKGLESILDSCSHLESLDLSQCTNLEFEDEDCSLRKRCTESIRDFRHPSDYFDYFDIDLILYGHY